MRHEPFRELWDDGVPAGVDCPLVSAADISRRVNAALDAVPSERTRYMRQKLRFAAVLTAAVVALAGTALAVASHWDVLDAYFKGDTAPAADLVDREVRSISDKAYTVTVESSVSDGSSALLLVRIDAHTEEARAFMASDDFNGIDLWNVYPLAPEVGEDGETALEYHGGSTSYSEVKELRTADSTTWRFDVSLSGADYTHMHVRMGYMDKGLVLEFPLTPAETVTVEIGATGEGLAWYDARALGPVTLDSVTISPLTLRVNVTWAMDGRKHESPLPPLLFRMADGSLRTMPQTLGKVSSSNDTEGEADDTLFHGSWVHRFQSVQDLSQLSGIVVWGREYPLEVGASKAVEVDSRLLPFQIPIGPSPNTGNVGFTVPVRALCQGLGADCGWDGETHTATMTYRGVTIALTWGSDIALVDGREVQLHAPVFVEDGTGQLYLSPDAPGAGSLQDGTLYVETTPLEEPWQIWINTSYDRAAQAYGGSWDVYP